MSGQIFILTASNASAYQHYIDTIENGFKINEISRFLNKDESEKLGIIYGDRYIKAWGAMPGPKNKEHWEQMEVGDKVLIYRIGNYEYWANVTYKTHNRELAKYLWKTDTVGKTWEYIYFLDNLTEISVPFKIFNDLTGFSDVFRPMGFSRLTEEKMRHIYRKFESIEGFLNYLVEGKWVEKTDLYTEKVESQIIQERISTQIEKTTLAEANLENFLAERVEQLEEGLTLVARQLDTGEVGRLDLLCEDKDSNLVVVELKKDKAGPSIIDQIQRYMGWIMKNKANPGQKVRGIIVVGKKDTALEYAARANPNISVRLFSIHFE